MSIKFTTTEIESNNGKLQLLFEFLDRELPEEFNIDYMYELAKSKYIGSLQSAQIIGAYLEPMMIQGKFIGSYVNANNEVITAKDRSDELGRLALRPIKFFFENFKQVVIFEHYKRKIKNLEYVEFELLMFPHDIQNPVKPSLSIKFKEDSKQYTETNTDDAPKDIDIEAKKSVEAKFEAINKQAVDPNAEAKNRLKKAQIEEKQQQTLEGQAHEAVKQTMLGKLGIGDTARKVYEAGKETAQSLKTGFKGYENDIFQYNGGSVK